MIRTSYFAKMRKFTNKQLDACICIARYQPKGVNLLMYLDVAPKDQILQMNSLVERNKPIGYDSAGITIHLQKEE